MAFLSPTNRQFLDAVSHLLYANPFLPEMVTFERQALRGEAVAEDPLWNNSVSDPDRVRANTWLIMKRLTPLVESLRAALAHNNVTPDETELLLYEDGLLYYFYYKYYAQLVHATFGAKGRGKERWAFYRDFCEEWQHYFQIANRTFPTGHQAAHTFACYSQIVRAFHHIFDQIIGSSEPAARLRASVWQSLFTHDIRRYRRTLYGRMSEFATLITGPSGTGKELVARAIAMSRYMPFDENKLAFEEDWSSLFFPINIAALPGTLVESELFGHKRGSFTGAVQDKRGWLEACPPLGAVFLDEIGELDSAIQVKLLRVIETRSFQAVGEGSAQLHKFEGKLIAATNQNLERAIRKRTFREDLYYRLCSDQIVTPSLGQQMEESPGVLKDLVLFMARRVAGSEELLLAEEALAWIEANLGANYAWPGNYRELEQCVRNILIRKDYHPHKEQQAKVQQANLNDPFHEARQGTLTANELLSRYCTLVYAQTGSYEETARKLGIDRRTVKAKVNEDLLRELKISKN